MKRPSGYAVLAVSSAYGPYLGPSGYAELALTKASMDALKKKIDDGIGKLDMSIKAMKEESDAKFEELKQ
ncbi:hypothetical protein Tco_0223332 [Tanacetum coccineum]